MNSIVVTVASLPGPFSDWEVQGNHSGDVDDALGDFLLRHSLKPPYLPMNVLANGLVSASTVPGYPLHHRVFSVLRQDGGPVDESVLLQMAAAFRMAYDRKLDAERQEVRRVAEAEALARKGRADAARRRLLPDDLYHSSGGASFFDIGKAAFGKDPSTKEAIERLMRYSRAEDDDAGYLEGSEYSYIITDIARCRRALRREARQQGHDPDAVEYKLGDDVYTWSSADFPGTLSPGPTLVKKASVLVAIPVSTE